MRENVDIEWIKKYVRLHSAEPCKGCQVTQRCNLSNIKCNPPQ